MRRRVLSLFYDLNFHQHADAARLVEAELGIDVPFGYVGGRAWDKFFGESELGDLLDSITIIFQMAGSKRSQDQWLNGIGRIFREENVHYSLDAKGGVHLAVDKAFAVTQAAAIAALQGERYAPALDAFQSAFKVFTDSGEPNGKTAIRSVFHASETLFKLMFPKAHRLAGSEIRDYLRPAVQRLYAQDKIAERAAQRLATSFGEWVELAHNYRHAQGAEELRQPPWEVTVATISAGAVFLRWMAEIDKRLSNVGGT